MIARRVREPEVALGVAASGVRLIHDRQIEVADWDEVFVTKKAYNICLFSDLTLTTGPPWRTVKAGLSSWHT